MQVQGLVRDLARRLVGPSGRRYIRRRLRATLPGLDSYRSLLSGRHALELGGPSDLFGDEGFLRVYGILGQVDNCLFAETTIWTGSVERGTFRHPSLRRPGRQLISEATDLKPVADGSYDCVLASHCLEHIANPLRALAEWSRVLTKDGFLLLVLPHGRHTFDWRRPVTPLSHLIEDRQREVGEDDQTHIPEVLSLHDLEKDPAAAPDDFRARCFNNYVHRAMHHHVFDFSSAVAMVDYAGFQVLRVDAFKPYHIIVLARRCETRPDNHLFLTPEAVSGHETSLDSGRR